VFRRTELRTIGGCPRQASIFLQEDPQMNGAHDAPA